MSLKKMIVTEAISNNPSVIPSYIQRPTGKPSAYQAFLQKELVKLGTQNILASIRTRGNLLCSIIVYYEKI